MERTFTVIAGSGGLGTALATQLVANNHIPMLISRNPKNPLIGGALYLSADLTTSEGIATLFERIPSHTMSKRFIITMGSALNKTLEESTEEEIRTCIQSNLVGPLLLIKGLIAYQKKHNCGWHLIVVTSRSAKEIRIGRESAYGGSKWGLRGALYNTTQEVLYSHHDARVTHFMPAGIRTLFWDSSSIDEDKLASFLDPADVAKQMLERIKAFEASPARFDEWTLARTQDNKPLPTEEEPVFADIQFKNAQPARFEKKG